MSGSTIEQTQGNAEWKTGLFGCFQDPKLCILACCVPCFVVGKNAEGLGENCLLHGLISMLGVGIGPVIRWRVRQDRNIKGSMLMDGLIYALCAPCALVQEARELAWAMPKEIANIGTKSEGQAMTRE